MTLTTLAIGALLAAAGASAQNSTSRCAPGLKMFVARGTSEPMGTGETGKLVNVIASQIPGSDIQAIEYPASTEDPLYFISVANGTMLVRQQVTAYARACPDSKMALFGYSQGAQIISNNLCGTPAVWAAYGIPSGGSTVGASAPNVSMLLELTKPLPREVTKNIASIMLFGDPSHSVNASYAFGNSTGGSGIFHRGDISECEALGPRLRSYCDAGDPYCDEGGAAPVSLTTHVLYIAAHGIELAQVVVDQFRNGAGASGNGTGGSSGAMPTNVVVPGAAAAVSSTPLLALGAVILVLGLM